MTTRIGLVCIICTLPIFVGEGFISRVRSAAAAAYLRSGQDRSLQSTRKRHSVGRGLDLRDVCRVAKSTGGMNPSLRAYFKFTPFPLLLQAPYKIRKNCAISADCDPVCYGNLKQKNVIMNKTTKQEGFFPMEHTGKRALGAGWRRGQGQLSDRRLARSAGAGLDA